MELDIIRKSWISLDTRMQKSALFDQKILDNIIASRVYSTVDRLKRRNTFFYTVLAVEFISFVAVLFGNPFDFAYRSQFIPYALLLAAVIIAFFNVLKLDRTIRKITPDLSIDQYIRKVLSAYDGNKKFQRIFALIFLAIGLLTPLSFLPKRIATVGLADSIFDIAIMILVILTIYFIAFKLGAFKTPDKLRLEKDLADWNELNQLVAELNESKSEEDR